MHCYAKMRIHHDATLTSLDESVSKLGELLRKFKDITCAVYETKELESETRRRITREVRRQEALKRTQTTDPKTNEESAIKHGRVEKKFNLNTPKIHALGHLKQSILTYGTTDSYSTHLVRSLCPSSCASLLMSLEGRNSP